jgi:hypothetical protein
MSKRFKKKSLDSNLFHHGLIKMLVIHRLKNLGDDWDRFLTRNGFATVTSVETHILGQPVIEQFGFSSNDLELWKENPCDEVIPNQFLHRKQDVGSESNETPVHELVVGLKATVKIDSKKPHKQSKENHADLGFRNKMASRLISRSLRNRSKPHLSSIDPIKINEDRDPEIEYFLAEEDPDCHKSDPIQPYDFVNNLPPCL